MNPYRKTAIESVSYFKAVVFIPQSAWDEAIIQIFGRSTVAVIDNSSLTRVEGLL
jgi:hypothetical protein